jgi:hypothetical protein
LEIEHYSHSEPIRFGGVAHGELQPRGGIIGVGNHAHSDIVMASDDRILMDNYHNRNPFIHNNPTGPASTQLNSDIH